MTGVQWQYRSRTTRSLAIAAVERESSSALSPAAAIERLRMALDPYHEPVLTREIVELFAGLAPGLVIDATVGGGGHSAALLSETDHLRVLGVDRDPAARRAARERLAEFPMRSRVVDATFDDLSAVVVDHRSFVRGEPVVGVLMDLGVSSHQLDTSSRGFSYRTDAPLDMRMDTRAGETAEQFIARIDVAELTSLLRENGEARFAGSIARSVIESRPQTTFELSAAVDRAVPKSARRHGHVAARTFQALRVAVNDELGQLARGLAAALDELAVGGLVIVVSYHSGEDRLVKSFFAEQQSGGCHCPRELGCVCGATARVKVLKSSARLASSREIEVNPRARSARLRAARKLRP